jgi:hypothetical protein
MGIGPAAVGLASDRFTSSFGNSALRWALFTVVTLASVLASVLFWLAGRNVPVDLHHEAPTGAAPALHSAVQS